MIKVAIALACAYLAVVAQAYSWSKMPSSIADTEAKYANDYADSAHGELAHEGYEAKLLRLGSDALERFQRQPDCFSRVAELIQHQCARLDHHQDERVAGAIMMTLCEIRTAKHYSVPMECSAFDVEALKAGQGESPLSGPCVDALARSAQLWSSYSGYLREIPLLCVAFRKLGDIDIARDLYRNVTLEKLDFLRFLKDHRNREMERQTRVFSQQQDLEGLLVDLNGAMSGLRAVVEADLIDSMRSTIAEMNSHFHLNTVAVIGDVERHHAELLGQSASSLASIISSHSAEASGIMLTMEAAVKRHVDMLAMQQMAQEERLALTNNFALEISSAMEQNMNRFSYAVELVNEKVAAIANNAGKVALNLEKIREGHIGLATITSDLTFSLRALTNHVQSELQAINTTIVDIQRSVYIRGPWNVTGRVLSSWLRFLPWFTLLLPSGFKALLLLFVLVPKLLLSFAVPCLVRWTVSTAMKSRSTRSATHAPNYITDGDEAAAKVYRPRLRMPFMPFAGIGQGQFYSIAQQNGRKSSRIPSRLLL